MVAGSFGVCGIEPLVDSGSGKDSNFDEVLEAVWLILGKSSHITTIET